MEMRRIGQSDISIAPMVLGCNVFGWTADAAMSVLILDKFIDSGFNCIDTSDVYGSGTINSEDGKSELIIGEWFKKSKRRDQVVLATKVGMWPKRPGLSASNIEAAVEDSLRRLCTDRIDIYQSHQDDLQTPQDETLTAYDRLVRAGKVRVIGASNFSADRLKSALDISEERNLPRYNSLQPPYSLIDRAIESSVLPLCIDNDVSVISYYGLARGFLTGKYRSEADLSKSARGEGNKRFFTETGMRVLSALDKISAETGFPLGQIALAWVAAKPGITAPIVSATNIDQLVQIMDAAHLKLNARHMTELDRAGDVSVDG